MSTVVLRKSDDIDKLKSSMHAAERKMAGIDTKKYFGVIKVKEDPVKYQNRIRSEWNEHSD